MYGMQVFYYNYEQIFISKVEKYQYGDIVC